MLNGAINGKMLNIRLNAGTVEAEQVPEETYRKYLGGYGIGARMIFDRVPAGAGAGARVPARGVRGRHRPGSGLLGLPGALCRGGTRRVGQGAGGITFVTTPDRRALTPPLLMLSMIFS